LIFLNDVTDADSGHFHPPLENEGYNEADSMIGILVALPSESQNSNSNEPRLTDDSDPKKRSRPQTGETSERIPLKFQRAFTKSRVTRWSFLGSERILILPNRYETKFESETVFSWRQPLLSRNGAKGEEEEKESFTF
jgi:hypothetical protein